MKKFNDFLYNELLSFKIFEEKDEINSSLFVVGMKVICNGTIFGLKIKDQRGIISFTNGELFLIEFDEQFDPLLHNCGGKLKKSNGWFVNEKNITLVNFKEIVDSEGNLPLVISKNFLSLMDGLKTMKDIGCFSNIHTDISFIDITKTGDTITYLNNKSFDRMKDIQECWNSNLRQITKIGKLFKKINPSISDKDLETDVTKFKGEFDLKFGSVSDMLKIVKGEDIRYWYLGDRYESGGNLAGACFRFKEKQSWFDLHVENQDKIFMIVMISPKNKLMGRSLLLKCDEPKEKYYMDYIYVCDMKYLKIFTEFAKKREFLTYLDNNLYTKKIRIHLKPTKNKPAYFDTLRYLEVNDKEIIIGNNA